nr:MAG TPA: hypothetical protein [Caudoviricetes sp.]
MNEKSTFETFMTVFCIKTNELNVQTRKIVCTKKKLN